MYHLTSCENARAAIDGNAAAHVAFLLLPGRDQVTLVDKARACSAFSTRSRMPGLSYPVPIVPAAAAVHSHGHIAPRCAGTSTGSPRSAQACTGPPLVLPAHGRIGSGLELL